MTDEERKRKIDAMRRFVPNDAGPMGPIGPSSQQTKNKSYWALPDNAANPMTWVKGVGHAAMDNLVEPMYDTFSGNNFRKYANPRSGQSIPQRLVGLGSDVLNIGSVIPAVKGLAMVPEVFAVSKAGKALANRQAMKEFGSFMDNVSPYEFNKWNDFVPGNKPTNIDITDDLAELDNLQPDDFITSLEDQGFTKPSPDANASQRPPRWEPQDPELRKIISEQDQIDLYNASRNQTSWHKMAQNDIASARAAMAEDPSYIERAIDPIFSSRARMKKRLINNFNQDAIDDVTRFPSRFKDGRLLPPEDTSGETVIKGVGKEYFYTPDVRDFLSLQKANDLLDAWMLASDNNDMEAKRRAFENIIRGLRRR